ncbi:hypothetical protein HUB97_05095 [Halorubraceae archaeon YAN]|nr:hypothetical protein [Halorubraceae archaeon YAN]
MSSHKANPQTASFEQQTFTHETVQLTRQPENRPDGAVITYTITSDETAPETIRFTDQFAAVDSCECGFHPQHAPTAWESNTTQNQLTITQELTETTETEFVLGVLSPDVSLSAADLRGSIEFIPDDTTHQPATEAADEDLSEDTTQSGGFFQRAKMTLLNGTEATPDTEPTTEGNTTQTPSADTDAPIDDETEAESDTDTDTTIAQKIPMREQQTESWDDDAWDTETTTKTGTNGTEAVNTDGSGAVEFDTDDNEPLTFESTDEPGGAKETEASTVDTDGSLLTALVSEIETGEHSPDELAALRKALDESYSPTEQIRLQHVQARMADFSAYLTQFEEFLEQYESLLSYAEQQQAAINGLEQTIDEHATAVETELLSLADTIEAVESSTEELATELHSVDHELSDLTTDVADIETTVHQAKTEHTAAIDALDTQYNTLQSELEALDTETTQEIDALRDAVSEFESVRGTLADAFGSGSDSGAAEKSEPDEIEW